MLIVRKEQLAAFDILFEEDFERRIHGILEKDHGELVENLDEETIRGCTKIGIRTGRDYGIELEKDLFEVVVLTFMLGMDFDTKPGNEWIADWLATGELAPGVRLREIRSRLNDESGKEDASVYPEMAI